MTVKKYDELDTDMKVKIDTAISEVQNSIQFYCPGIIFRLDAAYYNTILETLTLTLSLTHENAKIHTATVTFKSPSSRNGYRYVCDIVSMQTLENHQNKGAQWIMIICIIALGNLAPGTHPITYEMLAAAKASEKIAKNLNFTHCEDQEFELTISPLTAKRAFEKYHAHIQDRVFCKKDSEGGGKRTPSAYNLFVAKHLKTGKTMAQAAKLWDAEKKKKSNPEKK